MGRGGVFLSFFMPPGSAPRFCTPKAQSYQAPSFWSINHDLCTAGSASITGIGSKPALIQRTTHSRKKTSMSVSLYAFTCGALEGEFSRVMEGAEGRVTMPIPVFLFEHPKGRVLFDSGLHPDCQHDPVGRLGERMTSIYEIRFAPGEEIRARLEAIDRDPTRIDSIINCISFRPCPRRRPYPKSSMMVQRREWEARLNPDVAIPHGYDPRNYDIGHGLRLIDGESTSSAMVRSYACPPTATRRVTNRSG